LLNKALVVIAAGFGVGYMIYGKKKPAYAVAGGIFYGL
jgi:hypothetical protein